MSVLMTLALFYLPQCAFGAEFMSLKLGLHGSGKVGKWLPVQATATGLSAGEEVELTAAFSDPAGDTCIEIADRQTVGADGSVSLEGCIRVGRIVGTGVVSIRRAAGTERLLYRNILHGADIASGDQEDPVQTTLTVRKLETQTLLTFGELAGVEELLRNAVTYSTPGQLVLDGVQLDSLSEIPVTFGALDSIDFILVTDNFNASPEQVTVLRHWVKAGGRLIVSVAKDVAAYLDSDLGEWTGALFDVADAPISVRDLTPMQSFVSGASRLETNRDAWPMAVVRSDQIAAGVDSLKGPIVCTQSYGSGILTFIAVDVNKKPVSQWKSLPQFYEMLLLGDRLSHQTGNVSRTSRISQSGVSDLATQMLASVDAQTDTAGWSTWAIMAMVAGYLILIGPVDYLIVARLLKRPELTWVTFPLMIVGGAVLMMGASGRTSTTLNQLHVIDVLADKGEQSLVARSWMSVATSDTLRTDMAVVPSAALAGSDDSARAVLSWSGRPEDVYGGMYRTGGIGLGRQSYTHDQRKLQSLSSVPMLINGSRGLYSEWNRDLSEDMASSQLAASGYGMLSGSFQHHFPEPITDWVLVSGNRVYRTEAGSDLSVLEPEESCQLNGTTMYASDLKAYLNGSRIVTDQSGRSSRGSTQVVTPYDSRATDAAYIMMMASFYNAAGGGSYVGLSQTQLHCMEVSDTVRLNHAVLFGIVKTPVTELALGDERLEPKHNDTIVRIFLPVNRRPAGAQAMTKEDIEKAKEQSEN